MKIRRENLNEVFIMEKLNSFGKKKNAEEKKIPYRERLIYSTVRNWVGNIDTSSPEYVPVHMKKLLD